MNVNVNLYSFEVDHLRSPVAGSFVSSVRPLQPDSARSAAEICAPAEVVPAKAEALSNNELPDQPECVSVRFLQEPWASAG